MNLNLDEFLHLGYVKYDLLIFFGWKSGHSPQILFKPLVVWASRYTTGQKLQEIHVSLLRSSLLLSLLYHYYHHSKCVVHTKILLFYLWFETTVFYFGTCMVFWIVYCTIIIFYFDTYPLDSRLWARSTM